VLAGAQPLRLGASSPRGADPGHCGLVDPL